jgi:hypothetical protein
MRNGYLMWFLHIRIIGSYAYVLISGISTRPRRWIWYLMPTADVLVDVAVGHKVLSFMDGNAGYNQILMAEEDIPKTAFRCPGHVGLFEWIVMTFGLKNVGATYQRAMNYIFHDIISRIVEIYIDDVVVVWVCGGGTEAPRWTHTRSPEYPEDQRKTRERGLWLRQEIDTEP